MRIIIYLIHLYYITTKHTKITVNITVTLYLLVIYAYTYLFSVHVCMYECVTQKYLYFI